MKACNNWVLIKLKEETTQSGLVISNLNIGVIQSKGGNCSEDYQKGNNVYFNKRNAIDIEDCVLVTDNDIYTVID